MPTPALTPRVSRDGLLKMPPVTVAVLPSSSPARRFNAATSIAKLIQDYRRLKIAS